MCGIVGFVTNERYKNFGEKKKFLTQALVLDQLRGEDATGVYYVPHSADKAARPTPGYFKKCVNGADFVRDEDYQKILNNLDMHKYVVGHNRYATMGTKGKVTNAHPFMEGPITLVHNGGLHSMHELPMPKHKLALDVEVDSHVICHNLAEHSVEDVVKELQGAFTLVWHDSRDDTLNIIRNDKRPLAMARDRDSETIYFASEAAMLVWVAERNNIRLEDVVQPKPGRLIKYWPDNLMKPEVRDLELFTWAGRAWSNGSHRGRRGNFGFVPENEVDQLAIALRAANARQGSSPFPQEPTGSPLRLPVSSPRSSVDNSDSENGLVIINRRLRKVPRLAKELLDEYNMSHTETYAFSPDEASFLSHNGRIYGQVKGLLDNGDIAVVNSVFSAAYHANKDHDWVVAPLGVLEYSDGEKDYQETVCRLVRFAVPANYTFVRKDLEEEEEEDTTSMDARTAALVDAMTDEEDDIPFGSFPKSTHPDDGPWLKGPGGVLIPYAEWRELVSKGCDVCHASIYPRMDEEIAWFSTNKPVCIDCLEEERVKQCVH